MVDIDEFKALLKLARLSPNEYTNHLQIKQMHDALARKGGNPKTTMQNYDEYLLTENAIKLGEELLIESELNGSTIDLGNLAHKNLSQINELELLIEDREVDEEWINNDLGVKGLNLNVLDEIQQYDNLPVKHLKTQKPQVNQELIKLISDTERIIELYINKIIPLSNNENEINFIKGYLTGLVTAKVNYNNDNLMKEITEKYLNSDNYSRRNMSDGLSLSDILNDYSDDSVNVFEALLTSISTKKNGISNDSPYTFDYDSADLELNEDGLTQLTEFITQYNNDGLGKGEGFSKAKATVLSSGKIIKLNKQNITLVIPAIAAALNTYISGSGGGAGAGAGGPNLDDVINELKNTCVPKNKQLQIKRNQGENVNGGSQDYTPVIPNGSLVSSGYDSMEIREVIHYVAATGAEDALKQQYIKALNLVKQDNQLLEDAINNPNRIQVSDYSGCAELKQKADDLISILAELKNRNVITY